MKGIKILMLILVLISSFKALANRDSIPPNKLQPFQIDSFVCFSVNEAGLILDSLQYCSFLERYTQGLEAGETYSADLINGLRKENSILQNKNDNLEHQNQLLEGSMSIMRQKEDIYRENIQAQGDIIGLKNKQIKKAKTGKSIAWTVATGLGGVLVYFIVKSI